MSEFEPITVGIVISRENEMPGEAQSSVIRQLYPEKRLLVHDNRKKEDSIGKSFNTLVEKAKTKWILFLGDDDFISRDYLFSLMTYYQAYKEKNPGQDPVGVTSSMTMFFHDKPEKRVAIEATPTGMWQVEFLKKMPFNETLEKEVDSELFRRFNKTGEVLLHCETQFGYYYRQHGKNISGNKFDKRSRLFKEIEKKFKQYRGIVYEGV